MKIEKRAINQKGHTLAYRISGRWYTRPEAVSLAKKGKIDHVTVCHGPEGGYIRSKPGKRNLYSIPEVPVDTINIGVLK